MSEIDQIRDFVRTFAPRRVTIPGEGDFYVRPPSLREALTTYSLLGEIADEGGVEILRRTLGGWLPPDLFALVVSDRMTWKARGKLLLWLLKTGTAHQKRTPEEEARAANKDDLFVWARSRDWFEIVAEYRAVYGASLDEVLDESFPLFLNFSAKMDFVRAVAQVFDMGWYAAAKTGKGESIMSNAGFAKELRFKEAEYMSEEWVAEQVEKARRVKKDLWGKA